MTEICSVNSEGLPIDESGKLYSIPDWTVASITNGNKVTFYSDIFEYLEVLKSLETV